MAVETLQGTRQRLVDKEWLRRQLIAVYGPEVLVSDPSLTARNVREMMLVDGIDPDENSFSAELIRMRYEGE